MKRLLAFVIGVSLIFSTMSFQTLAEESYKDIFTKDNVIDVKISIDEADLADMRENAQNEEYHAADITVDGVEVKNVGIRTKGNMTLKSVASSESDRYSYRIKFNKYVKGNKLLGLDELCLNNGYSDPSYMREYLHYEYLRELGMNVPETVFCNVYINDEYAGFYLGVEGLDSTFLEENFGENYKNGNFYKMDEGSSLEYREKEDYSYADLKSGSDKELTEFKSFIKRLNSVPTGEKGDLESFLNVDSALKYIASNTVLCNYDSYSGNMHHNFYLYEDENGVFTVVPWDFNMSFGGFNGNNSEVGIDTPFISGSLENLPLIGKLLSVPEYKEKYYGYVKQLMSSLENFEDRVYELKGIIAEYVKEDSTAFYTYEQFEKATSNQDEIPSEALSPDKSEENGKGMRKTFGDGSSVIKCVSDRLENLNKQFEGTAEKTTESQNSFGGGHGRGDKNKGERPSGGNGNENIGDEQIPQMPNESWGNGNMDFSSGFDGGDRPAPPEFTPPGFGEDGQMPPVPPEFGKNNGEFSQPPDMGQDGGRPNGGFGPGFGRNDKDRENQKIRVHVNGHIISFDSDPYIKNNSTMVGFRKIFEALDAEVSWNEQTKEVTASKDSLEIKLTVGENTAVVNGEEKELLAAPEISGERVVIPIRFVAETFGMNVKWDETTRLVTVTNKKSE